MKRIHATIAVFIALCPLLQAVSASAMDADDGLPGLDVPGQEQKLNAELWRFAKNTSYDTLQEDLEKAQEKSRATVPTQVTLPNGWRMSPAGTQLELGRYPMVAVPFNGRIIVLNNGYYPLSSQNKPQLSVCDESASEILQSLPVTSLFPSALVGKDGDLYVSGGYDQSV